MEFINEVMLEEIDSNDSLTQSSVLETTPNISMLDPLSGESSTEPLVGGISSDFLAGDVTSSQTDIPKTLEVTGRGVISVDTDTAQVRLGIELEGATATEVQQEVARNSSAIVEQLDRLEVEELQTVSISLQPRLEFDDLGNRTVVGFTGRNILQFEVSTEQAGETIDTAIQAGANTIENINFVASDSELNQARLDAIRLAAQDAQNQADPLLDVLGLTPLEIVDIDIIGVNNPAPRSFSSQLDVAAFDVSTPIIGGSQDVVADVALDISYAEL